jgi:RNA polymerase sigma-70 factor (ECF subfamily)
MILARDPLKNADVLIRKVYSYVAYRIGAGADAEDVVSEVFERAVRYRSSYDAGKGPPIAWLVGIARSVLADHLRERAARMDGDSHIDQSIDGIETQIVDRLMLHAAIARLGEREREFVALYYGAGFTARQIADLVGVQKNSVEVALHRARSRLATILEGEPQVAP